MHPDIPPSLDQLLSAAHVPQRGFTWPKERWGTWLLDIDGARELLDSLPSAVDRATTAATVQDSINQDAIPAAFIACMVWGHGHSGYGPFRTARILSASLEPVDKSVDATVVDRLKTSIERVRVAGSVEAYRYLNNEGHIGGLGPAFFTKWLYFASAGEKPYGAQAAPVLDELVTAWLREHASVALRYGSTKDYARYVELLEHWGDAHGRTQVQVEEGIFRLIRDDGGHREPN